MPERKEGFLYIKSELLKQEVAMSLKTGWVYCEDKGPDGKLVTYSPAELDVLAKTGSVITPGLHAVKKIIGGTIVEYEERNGTGDKGKSNPGAPNNGSDNNKNPPGSIQGAGGNDKADGEGELDIY
jgi:hypothetical protein